MFMVKIDACPLICSFLQSEMVFFLVLGEIAQPLFLLPVHAPKIAWVLKRWTDEDYSLIDVVRSNAM